MAKKKVIAASRPKKRQTRRERLRNRRDSRASRRARRTVCPGCDSGQVKTACFAPVDQEQLDQMRCQRCGMYFDRQIGWVPGEGFPEIKDERRFRRR